ncbi:cAMP-binding domain of CRP or a regulatory subunit of cAMP-dependent protein kinases [Sphingomonas guangdongensis]|uniref:cAMP-binding domain of CRP or a regulatory subunit of cAMP-dependent protein kinases n=1 Tax=Sphingomonas guangdongensis TaxID=1141890 RepID=A0A285QGD1_9SPHN|nr:cAMP-binding domain of CRP or a regulatory subunit of cAMP-dependent protein kinases [Sphingomonas guangdongensis]
MRLIDFNALIPGQCFGSRRLGGSEYVPASYFAEVLGEHVELSEGERSALTRLEERTRSLRRGAILQRENEAGGELYIVRSGTVMSYVLLDDGSRQILRFHYAGAMLGVPGLIYRTAPETIAALTDAVVCVFDKATFSRLIADHPRIGALVLALAQIERVALTDRLAAIGRTSAKARVAALLLDLRNRMRAADRSITDSYQLGLTQEEIGDATGLTAVHVNRMLRQVEEDGLIRREAGRVTILDERGLTRAANYIDRYEDLDLSWLPPRD